MPFGHTVCQRSPIHFNINHAEGHREAMISGVTKVCDDIKSEMTDIVNITKDNINICQTGNLIFALARNNQEFAESVAAMVFQGVKQTEYYMNFFRLLTLLTELPGAGGPPGMPCFTSLVMHKVWELAKTCPQPALDWLSIQVARNRYRILSS